MKLKSTLFLSIFVLCAFTSADLKPIDANDSVTFIIRNFGINTKGEFKGLKGTIKWDPANPAASSFNVSVDAATVNTGIDSRDEHLRKDDYFDVAKYPTLNFVSTSVSGNTVTGNITIKGVTKQISFPFTVTTSGSSYIFSGNFTLNRLDFNVGSSSMVLSNSVNVSLRVQAKS